MSIRRLPSELINRIAAGEVVERPGERAEGTGRKRARRRRAPGRGAAAAGGLELIEVPTTAAEWRRTRCASRSSGTPPRSCPTTRSTRVTSFGFRGEALPSIASVARLTLESRVRGADGWRIEIDHGVKRRARGRPRFRRARGSGRGLFDKVPARRKFLRSPRAEYAACLDAVKRLAMARSDVGFSLDHDGRRSCRSSRRTRRRGSPRCSSHELDRHGLGIDCVRDGLRLTGVVSLPTFNRGMADQQFCSSIRGR
jgi:DNA mismatch repair protein MutL